MDGIEPILTGLSIRNLWPKKSLMLDSCDPLFICNDKTNKHTCGGSMKPYIKHFKESNFIIKLKKADRVTFYLETLTGKSFSIQDKSGMTEVLRQINAVFSEKNDVPFLNGTNDIEVILDYVKDEPEVILSVDAEKFKKLVSI